MERKKAAWTGLSSAARSLRQSEKARELARLYREIAPGLPAGGAVVREKFHHRPEHRIRDRQMEVLPIKFPTEIPSCWTLSTRPSIPGFPGLGQLCRSPGGIGAGGRWPRNESTAGRFQTKRQGQLQIYGIEPLIEFLADIPQMSDLLKSEFLMQAQARGLIR